VARHRVLVGINYPDGKGGEKRAEPGDVVDDLDEKSAKNLAKAGAIEPATAKAKRPEEAEG
jgi:hypothetical protein